MSAPNACLFSTTRFLHSWQKIFTNKNIFSKHYLHVLFISFFFVKCIIKKNYLPSYGPLKHLLAEPIAFLVNESFACGVFPNIEKRAVITPIFKKDNYLIVSNYRPMSVLHWLSKIFEKSISKQIISFAKKMSLFSSCQFGFHSGMSTVDVIIRLFDLIPE